MPHRPKIAAVLLALGLAAAVGGCATPASAPAPSGPIAITPQTNATLAAYLRVVRNTRPGAFAVSPDGRNSFFTYCEEISCATASYSAPALRGCRSLSGTPCLILYVRNEQRLPYTRTEGLMAGGRHGSEKQRVIEFDNAGGRS